MTTHRPWLAALLILGAGTIPDRSAAGEVRVAVASNFAAAMTEIAARFEVQTGHRVLLSFGATGKHYAQIVHGAPFDLFFAADTERPERLEREALAVAGSRFTYAVGALVLWSPDPGRVDADGAVLQSGDYRFLAIANPALAPYGRAAREVLEHLGLWERLEHRIVRGENIGQAYQYVHSGNAQLGFISRSQWLRQGGPAAGSAWEVPEYLHHAIEQQVVLLRESAPARSLMDFVRRAEALRLIEESGYRRP